MIYLLAFLFLFIIPISAHSNYLYGFQDKNNKNNNEYLNGYINDKDPSISELQELDYNSVYYNNSFSPQT